MSVKMPFMVIGHNASLEKDLAIVEVEVGIQGFLDGDQYQIAGELAQDHGLRGPMAALGPEELELLIDGVASMKQLMMGRERLLTILARVRSEDAKKLLEIA